MAHFRKGSPEAKAYMAKLRKMQGSRRPANPLDREERAFMRGHVAAHAEDVRRFGGARQRFGNPGPGNLLRWLEWNDPNGDYRGEPPLGRDEAAEIIAGQLEGSLGPGETPLEALRDPRSPRLTADEEALVLAAGRRGNPLDRDESRRALGDWRGNLRAAANLKRAGVYGTAQRLIGNVEGRADVVERFGTQFSGRDAMNAARTANPEDLGTFPIDTRSWGPPYCETCDEDLEDAVLLPSGKFACPTCRTPIKGGLDAGSFVDPAAVRIALRRASRAANPPMLILGNPPRTAPSGGWKKSPSVTPGGKAYFHTRFSPSGKRQSVVWNRDVRAFQLAEELPTWDPVRRGMRTIGYFDTPKQAFRAAPNPLTRREAEEMGTHADRVDYAGTSAWRASRFGEAARRQGMVAGIEHVIAKTGPMKVRFGAGRRSVLALRESAWSARRADRGVNPVERVKKGFGQYGDTVTYTLPAYWASYLINGDASGLEEGEQKQIDRFMRREGDPQILDVGEEYFSHDNDATNLGGDVADYTAWIPQERGTWRRSLLYRPGFQRTPGSGRMTRRKWNPLDADEAHAVLGTVARDMTHSRESRKRGDVVDAGINLGAAMGAADVVGQFGEFESVRKRGRRFSSRANDLRSGLQDWEGSRHGNPAAEPVDEEAAVELRIYIDGDRALYDGQGAAIRRNLMTKWAQGKYNSARAVDAFMHLAETGARKYMAEFGTRGEPIGSVFSVATRRLVATWLRDTFEVEAKLGNMAGYLPARHSGFRPNPPATDELPARYADDPAFKRELAAYRKMHGNDPVAIVEVEVPDGYPRFMSAYGTTPEVVYDATKKSTKGKRIHKFGEEGGAVPFLVTSQERGPKFLAFAGGTFAAKEWIYK